MAFVWGLLYGSAGRAGRLTIGNGGLGADPESAPGGTKSKDYDNTQQVLLGQI